MDKSRRKKKLDSRALSFLLPTYLPLDQFNVLDVQRWQSGQQKLKDFYGQWYFELARQRSRAKESINRSLQKASTPYSFSPCYRVFRFKWALGPLSSKGSLKVPGGRFNIGDIDESLFQKFPALYLAEDADTALCEMIGPRRNPLETFNQFDLASINEKSLSIVATYGELESVVDLTNRECLKEFIDVVKTFTVSKSLEKLAQEVRINLNGGTVNSVDLLMETLMNPNWRQFPMHVDVPANSQIFGQLVWDAGIEGVVYSSKYTNKKCFAIFPNNLKGGDSFVEIMDDVPKGAIKRLDSKTWEKLI